jgi:hypothetical protein
MLTAKKDNITLVTCAAKSNGVAISLCFELAAAGNILQSLICGQCCNCCDGKPCFPKGSEEAILGFCLFNKVRSKLVGGPQAACKTGVGVVTCGVDQGMFYINWNSNNNASSVRKTLGIALKSLDPMGMNSTYSDICKVLKGDPAGFQKVATACAAAINAKVHITVVGRIKLTKEKNDQILSVLVGKSKPRPGGNGGSAVEYRACHCSNSHVAASGWVRSYLADLLRVKKPGVLPSVSDGVSIGLEEKKWDAISKKIKNKSSDFVSATKKIVKNKDVLCCYAFKCLLSGEICGVSAASMISNFNPDSAVGKL